MDIKNLDLNLLKVFEAVYRGKNLTRAAKEMSLSQPAISYSLGKLREFFKDPLFVREGHAMVPTPRAEALNTDVKAALSLIRDLLDHGGSKDPSESSRTFVIGISNYCSLTLLPELVACLSKAAPAMAIRTCHCTIAQRIAGLEEGSLDLVFAGAMENKAKLKVQTLYTDHEICIAGASSSIPQRPVQPEELGRYPFIRYEMSPGERLDLFRQLDERKILLQTRAITDQELMVPELVDRINGVGIVASKVGYVFKEKLKLKTMPIMGMETSFKVRQYWHPRHDNDPVHTWFRNLVKEIATPLSVDTPVCTELESPTQMR
ncbi:MAG: LysR family transcriptional regulator [Desulfobacterales bacterium]|nr:LysR family transcriptional regulator [Desulfobacterales bacterium]